MNSVAPLVLAFASTLIIGAITRFAASFFGSDRDSRVAGFCVALGYAIGHFSYAGPAAVEDLPAIGAATGAIAALVVVWFWLLRRSSDELTGAGG